MIFYYFNNVSIEEYISRSYSISNGRASSSDLHIKSSKLFLHFCLLHIMHAFSRLVGKYFRVHKRVTMHCRYMYLSLSLSVQKNSQFSGKSFTASLFYYFRATKQLKLIYTLNALNLSMSKIA